MIVSQEDMGGLNAIFEEIYVPCFRSGDEHPCKACVQIGLEKAYAFGLDQGEKKADRLRHQSDDLGILKKALGSYK